MEFSHPLQESSHCRDFCLDISSHKLWVHKEQELWVFFSAIGATHPSTVLGTKLTEYENVGVKATTSFTPSIQSAITRLVSMFPNLLLLNTGTIQTKTISGGCPKPNVSGPLLLSVPIPP